MLSTMQLIGAEEVNNAGRNVLRAAETMERAASYYSDVCRAQQQYLDALLDRLQQILADARKVNL